MGVSDREIGRVRQLRIKSAINMGKLDEIRKNTQDSSSLLSKRRIHKLFDYARAFDCRDAKD